MPVISLPKEKNHIILETSDQHQECNMEKNPSLGNERKNCWYYPYTKNCVCCVCEKTNCMECSDKNCIFFHSCTVHLDTIKVFIYQLMHKKVALKDY
jgi:hypothetical protein